MSEEKPTQAIRTAWLNLTRDEAKRIGRIDVSRIVHIGWVIAVYADSDGTNSTPAAPTIARVAGCSEETVTRAVRVLMAVGLLRRRRRPNTSSAYQLIVPLGGRLDWDAHMHLYTDTRQARRKAAIKEKEIKEMLAAVEEERVPVEGNPVRNGFRTPTRNGDQEGRNPFPAGVPEPVPAGGSGKAGTRSGTGAEPDAERVPEPVPAGGEQSSSPLRGDKRLDKDPTGAGEQPQDARANAPGDGSGTLPQPALHVVPAPRGTRSRSTPPVQGASQPPLLLAVPGLDLETIRATATPEDIRWVLQHQGRVRALELFGIALVGPELAALDAAPGGHPGQPAPAERDRPEVAAACPQCKARPGAACDVRPGARDDVHPVRAMAWSVTRTACPDCGAPAGSPCLRGDGRPWRDAHPRRIDAARAAHDHAHQPPTTSTGT